MQLNHVLTRKFLLHLSLVVILVFTATTDAFGRQDKAEPAEIKPASPDLSISASDAYKRWLADPVNTKILDVRTLEEYIFTGHTEMAWNVPLYFQTDKWDADKRQYTMLPNLDFMFLANLVVKPGDTVLVMCRSGGRGAMAVKKLVEAGYTEVYNIQHGMEGDKVTDAESAFLGQRLKNGWKNSGLPWTYDIDPTKTQISESH